MCQALALNAALLLSDISESDPSSLISSHSLWGSLGRFQCTSLLASGSDWFYLSPGRSFVALSSPDSHPAGSVIHPVGEEVGVLGVILG